MAQLPHCKVHMLRHNYLFLFCKKAQDTTEAAFHDCATVQDIPPSTSCPNEGLSEPYLNINNFSQLVTVIFVNNDFSCPNMHRETSYFVLLFCRHQAPVILMLISGNTVRGVVFGE